MMQEDASTIIYKKEKCLWPGPGYKHITGWLPDNAEISQRKLNVMKCP